MDVVLTRRRWKHKFTPLFPSLLALAASPWACTEGSTELHMQQFSFLKWLAQQTGSDNFRREGLSLGNLKLAS